MATAGLVTYIIFTQFINQCKTLLSIPWLYQDVFFIVPILSRTPLDYRPADIVFIYALNACTWQWWVCVTSVKMPCTHPQQLNLNHSLTWGQTHHTNIVGVVINVSSPVVENGCNIGTGSHHCCVFLKLCTDAALFETDCGWSYLPSHDQSRPELRAAVWVGQLVLFVGSGSQ